MTVWSDNSCLACLLKEISSFNLTLVLQHDQKRNKQDRSQVLVLAYRWCLCVHYLIYLATEVRAQIPLAAKALTAAVRELMVMEEQREDAGESDSDDSEGEEIQDEMKALMVPRFFLHLTFYRCC